MSVVLYLILSGFIVYPLWKNLFHHSGKHRVNSISNNITGKGKLKFALLTVVSILLAGIPAFAGETNLVRNPGFEEPSSQGFSPWTKKRWTQGNDAAEVRVDKTQKYSGSKSICIINKSANDSHLEQEVKAGISPIKLYRNETPAANPLPNRAKGSYGEFPLLAYAAIFFIAAALAYCLRVYGKFSVNPAYENPILFSILGLGFLARLIIAPKIEGFSVDINCFQAWAAAAARDLPNFYNTGMFCDYPPFYIYVLFLMGKIAALPGMGTAMLLLVKLPSILADIVTAYLLYEIAKRQQLRETGLLIAAFYTLNPAVFINSTLWGQVDSFFTLMVVTALLLLSNKKLALSSVVFTASVLMKPQGLIFLPVLLYDLIKRKNLKNFFISAVSGLATAVAVILPFSRDPMWIFRLFTKTASGYTYASLNAFNFFSLIGANLKQDSEVAFLFSYNTWGNLLALLVVSFTFFLYIKAKNPQILFLAAALQITGVFMLWSRMHERYLFPAAALCLIAFLFLKDRRLLLLAGGLSATIYLNTHVVLYRMLNFNTPHVPAKDPLLFWVSLANVLLLAYLVKVSVDIVIRNRTQLWDRGGLAAKNIPKAKRR